MVFLSNTRIASSLDALFEPHRREALFCSVCRWADPDFLGAAPLVRSDSQLEAFILAAMRLRVEWQDSDS